jgi:hypothetical protein
MLWIFLALLLAMGLFSLFATYTLVGGIVQIAVICSLAVVAIQRIWRMPARRLFC